MWVKRELSYALNQKRLLNKIVPVVYRKCDFDDVHWTLGTLQMVGMTGDFTKGCSVLLKSWGVNSATVDAHSSLVLRRWAFFEACWRLAATLRLRAPRLGRRF